jgi:imidazolonepropionase-like amidohydrolase
VLFRNVRVFSGTGSALSDPTRVLVSGNVIERIAEVVREANPNERIGYSYVAVHAYTLAKKFGVKLAFGTDIQFNPKGAERMPFYLPKLVRWFSPAEVLRMATRDNAQLLALSGPRSPYPGKLGVVEVGALADLLLVDGDPIANIKLLEDPSRNLLVIMKDGKIQKAAGAVIGSGAP